MGRLRDMVPTRREIRKKYGMGLNKIQRLWDLDSRLKAREWVGTAESDIDKIHRKNPLAFQDAFGKTQTQEEAHVSNVKNIINTKALANKKEKQVTKTENDDNNKTEENMAAPWGAIVAAIQEGVEGMAGIASGLVGRRKREREARLAGEDFQAQMGALRAQDVSNPFKNVQNTFEDLTINQKEADFLAGQQQLGMATTMSKLRRSVGSSGMAGMAQAMANQQSVNLEKSAAVIGAQESANIRMAAQGKFEQEKMFAMGEKEQRMMEFAKQNTLLAMTSDRKIAADEAMAAARQAMYTGIGGMMSAGGAMGAYFGMKDD